MKINCVILISLVFSMPASILHAQSSGANAVIIYNRNISQPLGGGQIPFDKRFTLLVPKFNTENIRDVFAYKAVFESGERQLVHTKKNGLIHDLDLEFDTFNDTLSISFPALKPNRSFDLAVTRSISGANLKTLLTLNEAISSNNASDADRLFNKIRRDAVEDAGTERVSFFTYSSLVHYLAFYNSKLSGAYNNLHNSNLYGFVNFPDITEIQRMQDKFSTFDIPFKDLNRITRITEDDSISSIFLGTQPMKYDGKASFTNAPDYETRIKNITSSLLYFDTLSNALNAYLAIETDAHIETDLVTINRIIETLTANKAFLETNNKRINDAISNNEDISETELLIGTTEFKDIQTAGGNLITLDLGLANMGVTDIRNHYVYMPKPYYGINIYFRPIDRNTRKLDFPPKYTINPRKGPLRSLQTVRDLRQRLSLCIGITFTSMSNKQFDYLFNSSALLVGPGYRLGKFLKINAGISLMKRTNKNPLISDKQVVAGQFISLSADIDLVQGIKDFTSIIFK